MDARDSSPYRHHSSSFIRLTEDPELELWVLILPPAGALYPGFASDANSPATPTLATPRPSNSRGSGWPATPLARSQQPDDLSIAER